MASMTPCIKWSLQKRQSRHALSMTASKVSSSKSSFRTSIVLSSLKKNIRSNLAFGSWINKPLLKSQYNSNFQILKSIILSSSLYEWITWISCTHNQYFIFLWNVIAEETSDIKVFVVPIHSIWIVGVIIIPIALLVKFLQVKTHKIIIENSNPQIYFKSIQKNLSPIMRSPCSSYSCLEIHKDRKLLN